MTLMRKAAVAVAIATAAVLGCAAQVNAADKGGPKTFEEIDITTKKPFSWTGMYIGGNVGYTLSDTKLSGEVYGDPASIEGLSGRGPVGGVHLGFDYQLPGTALVLGARGGYSFGNVEFKVMYDGDKALGVSIEDGWYIDGRIGVVMGSAMPYVFGGWTEVKTSASFFGEPVVTPDLEGYRLGAGVEWRLNTKVMTLTPTVAFEYAYTDFKQVVSDDMKIDPTTHAFMARLNLRFGTQ